MRRQAPTKKGGSPVGLWWERIPGREQQRQGPEAGARWALQSGTRAPPTVPLPLGWL